MLKAKTERGTFETKCKKCKAAFPSAGNKMYLIVKGRAVLCQCIFCSECTDIQFSPVLFYHKFRTEEIVDLINNKGSLTLRGILDGNYRFISRQMLKNMLLLKTSDKKR
jgi:hypothetical protein